MKFTYEYEKVKCGKKNCKSCPHGPYWYAYYRDGNRLKKVYIGKKFHTLDNEVGNQAELVKKDHRCEIFNPKTATRKLALSILLLQDPVNEDSIRLQYRKLSVLHHPDRGGDLLECQLVNAAYDYLER